MFLAVRIARSPHFVAGSPFCTPIPICLSRVLVILDDSGAPLHVLSVSCIFVVFLTYFWDGATHVCRNHRNARVGLGLNVIVPCEAQVRGARLANVPMVWVEEQRRRKWRWAGHVSRRDDGRWSRRLLDWGPLGGRRSWGRPLLRWEDALCHFARTKGETWSKAGRDKVKWASWEDEFAATRW